MGYWKRIGPTFLIFQQHLRRDFQKISFLLHQEPVLFRTCCEPSDKCAYLNPEWWNLLRNFKFKSLKTATQPKS